MARAVLSAEGCRPLKAQITEIVPMADTRRFVRLRRAENAAADAKEYPVITSGIRLVVGAWIFGLEVPGGIMILGREAVATDPDTYGLQNGSEIADRVLYWRHIIAGSLTDDLMTQNYSLSTHLHDTRYSLVSHGHFGVYSPVGHLHNDSYSQLGHTHNYAPANHNHNSDYSQLGHTHNYAPAGHNHSGQYSPVGHGHGNDSWFQNHTHSGYVRTSQLGTHNTGGYSYVIWR